MIAGTTIEITGGEYNRFGVETGETYKTVNCPAEFIGQFRSNIWVEGGDGKGPVRILENNYQIIEDQI